MTVAIRSFQKKDIPFKVKWINDENNNKFLHYDLPLREDKTLEWYKTLRDRKDRVDYTITYHGEPAGLIGLLNIDLNQKNAEYYICLGEEKFKGKNIASVSTDYLLKKAHVEFGLQQIYLYTEVGNVQAQRLFEKQGFSQDQLLEKHLFHNGKYVDRYLYTLNLETYIEGAL